MPIARALSTTRREASTGRAPKLLQPSPTTDTAIPDFPSWRFSMTRPPGCCGKVSAVWASRKHDATLAHHGARTLLGVLRKWSEGKRLLVAHEGDECQQFPEILHQRETEILEFVIAATVDRDHHELHHGKQKDDVDDEPGDEAVANRIEQPRGGKWRVRCGALSTRRWSTTRRRPIGRRNCSARIAHSVLHFGAAKLSTAPSLYLRCPRRASSVAARLTRGKAENSLKWARQDQSRKITTHVVLPGDRLDLPARANASQAGHKIDDEPHRAEAKNLGRPDGQERHSRDVQIGLAQTHHADGPTHQTGNRARGADDSHIVAPIQRNEKRRARKSTKDKEDDKGYAAIATRHDWAECEKPDTVDGEMCRIGVQQHVGEERQHVGQHPGRGLTGIARGIERVVVEDLFRYCGRCQDSQHVCGDENADQTQNRSRGTQERLARGLAFHEECHEL